MLLAMRKESQEQPAWQTHWRPWLRCPRVFWRTTDPPTRVRDASWPACSGFRGDNLWMMRSTHREAQQSRGPAGDACLNRRSLWAASSGTHRGAAFGGRLPRWMPSLWQTRLTRL